jgi:hypothetical protein
MKTKRERKERSKENQAKALESVLYEMLILTSALLLRDKRGHFKNYEGLFWGPPQIAHDVIRLKARLLHDFFTNKSKYESDMIADDFTVNNPLTTLDGDTRKALTEFSKKADKWTIHLTWTRTDKLG